MTTVLLIEEEIQTRMALRRALSSQGYTVLVTSSGVEALEIAASEALGLTVPRVDFLRRKIHVLSQAQRGQIAADLKTEPSTRTIPADE